MNKGVTALMWSIRVAVSLWVTVVFFYSPGVSGYTPADFPEMIYGQSHRPFVTRALFPAVVRVVSQAIPSTFDSALENSKLGSRILSSRYVQEELKWRPPFLREYLVAFLLSVVCVVLLSLTMEALWKELFRPATPQAYLFSTLGVLGLPVCFKYYSHIYDLPSLLLYTVCILLMARRLWGWYFLLFTLSCLSKETTALLIIVFALYFIRCAGTERRTYWGFICIQFVILLATRGAIAWVFRNNPGSTFEIHLFDHSLRVLSRPWSIETLTAWGVLAALCFLHFGRKPWLLRVAAGMIVPLVACCLFFGFVDELRDYYEVYVPIAALVGYSVCRLLGCCIETTAPTDASSVRCIRAAADA
jgi:hypothetical protein